MEHIFTIIIAMVVVFLSASNIPAHPAWGIVVDSRKQIYFSDLETIYKIDAQRKLSIFRIGVSGQHIHDITIDAEDNIYGVDNSYNPQTETYPRALWKMSIQGEFSYLVSPTDNLPTGRSVWLDPAGNTYSFEPYNNEKKEAKIIRRAPSGETCIFAGGKYGYLDAQKHKAEFGTITDMAFGAGDAIYLTDGDKVRKIDESGAVTTIYRPKVSAANRKNPKSSTRLFGLCIDNQNNVFVADPKNRRVLKVFPRGENSVLLSTEEPWEPNGVASNGSDTYVLESWHDERERFIGTRVKKLSSDGRITVLATVGDSPNRAANDNPAIENTVINVANSNPPIEETKPNPQNRNNVPYVLLGTGIGLATAIAVIWHYNRKLFI